MGHFVYGPCSLLGTFLLGLAVAYPLGLADFGMRIGEPAQCAADRAESPDELADEWAVYQALIKEEGLSESHILIIDNSWSFSYSTDEPIIPEASAVTNAAYREMNRSEYSLSCLFASRGASFITKEEIQTFPERNFWRSFRFSHPLTSGMLSLSRVGFNYSRTEAIVGFDFACGGLCEHGATWKFTKIDGKWQKTGGSKFEIYS